MALLGITLSDLLGGGGGAAPTIASSSSVAAAAVSLTSAPTAAATPSVAAAALVGQEGANLGPLTTTFTPPPACATAVAACPTCNSALLGQSCDAAGAPVDAASCWPAMTGAAASPSAPFHGLGFYSPGVACPNGYASACSATAGASSGWAMQFNLAALETAVGCCPNGYQCGNVGGQTCIQIATSTSVPTVACGAGKYGAAGAQTVPDKAAAISAYTLMAPMIQINFQSSDLAGAAAGAAKTTSSKPPGSTLVTSVISSSASLSSSSASASGSSPTSGSSESTEALTSIITAAPTTLLLASSGGALDTDAGAVPSMTGGTMVVSLPSSPGADNQPAAATDTADASLASTTPAAPAAKSTTVSMPARVAAAVGGGVGVLAIVVGAVLINRRLWRERRNKARDSMMMKLSDYDPNASKPTMFTEPDLLPGGRGRRTFMGGAMFQGYRM